VRESAAQNEEFEAPKHPTEGQVTPPSDKVDQGKRNGEVGQQNETVGNGMQHY
jgi:hypothetical protein